MLNDWRKALNPQTNIKWLTVSLSQSRINTSFQFFRTTCNSRMSGGGIFVFNALTISQIGQSLFRIHHHNQEQKTKRLLTPTHSTKNFFSLNHRSNMGSWLLSKRNGTVQYLRHKKSYTSRQIIPLERTSLVYVESHSWFGAFRTTSFVHCRGAGWLRLIRNWNQSRHSII